ncbi:hypothetical protein TRFO_11936 [Tritrichomonas foetus]|uniref:Uncharacterized protein n=1 Tax=Tritrichomonas foetus TaxID=1144522 RepID=A0A1J4J6M8_9EUKA|nr:hypothetical protein TRFO_11936 [Tritrichomonas foetus]|eukprot:OHS93307.1 hypothetical protein TRFO_11936 [Tritrichomonas foetus]
MIQNIYQHVLSPLISCCTANYLNCIFSIISIKNVEILYNSIGIQMSNTMCTVFTAKKMLFSENNIFISIQPQTLKIPSILTPLDIEEQIKGSFATFINISDDVLIGFHLSNYIISSMNQLMKKNIITPQCQLIIDLENSFYDYFVHDFPFRSIISIQKFELNMSYPDFIGEITSRFVVYVSNNRNSIPASLFNVEKDKFQLYDFAKIGTINLDSFNRSYSDESNREIIHNHIKSISIDGAFCSDSVSLLSAYFSHYYGHKSNESFDKKTFEEEFKRIFNESKQDITLDPQIDLSHSFIKINSALDDLSLMLHKFENEIPGYDINCSEKKINDCERSKVFTGEIGNMEILWSIKSLILTIKLFNGRDFSQKYDFSNICKIPEYINEVVDDDFEWISLRDTSQNLQIESNTSIYIKLYDFNDFIKKSVSCQVNQFSIKDNLLNSSSKYLVTVDQNSHNNFSLEYEHLFNGNSRLYVDLPRFLFYITDQQINYILEFSKNPTISMYCNFPKMYFENVILRFSEIYLNGAFHCYGDFLLDNITVVIPCYQFYGVNGIDELVGDILKSLWADIFKDKASEFVINNTILSNLRVITNTIKPIISLHIKKRGIIRGLIGGLTEMAEIINIESMNGNSRINIIQRIYTLTIKYMDHLQEIDAKSYSHSFSTFIVTKSNTNSKYRISIVPRSFKYRGLNDIKNNIFKNVNKNLIKQ